MKAVPKEIPQQLVTLKSPTDTIFLLNELECLDLRIQICKLQESGWTGEWNGQQFEIDKNGDVIHWPYNLFSEDFLLFIELTKLQLENRIKNEQVSSL